MARCGGTLGIVGVCGSALQCPGLSQLQKASKDKCQVLEQAVPTPPDLLMLPDEVTDPSLDSVQPMAVWRTGTSYVLRVSTLCSPTF